MKPRHSDFKGRASPAAHLVYKDADWRDNVKIDLLNKLSMTRKSQDLIDFENTT